MLRPEFVLALATLSGLVSAILSFRANRKARVRIAREEAWPAFVDNLVSVVSSGYSLTEALDVSCSRAPRVLEECLSNFLDQFKRHRLVDSLAAMSSSFESHAVDEFAKLLTIQEQLGGTGLVALLKAHAQRCRASNAARSEARAKRAATLTMAKLGVTAPWILLALLLSRSESAESFASPSGVTILLVGLLVCAVAFRLVSVLGRSRGLVRVYAQR